MPLSNELKARFQIYDNKIASQDDKIARLETLSFNTGESFARICDAIDGVHTTKTGRNEEYHCCVNREDNKMHCAPTTLASAFGIDTSNGDNTCDSRNTAQLCSND